ncbi:MAG: hypothetical protein ABIX28_14000 [Vicinamibacterales bacterium]
MSIRTRAAVVVIVAAVSSSTPLSAVQRPPEPSADRERATPADRSATGAGQPVGKSFKQLFTAQPPTPPDLLHLQDRVRDRLRVLEAGATRMPPARTVCGLTVWDIDPNIDPRMRLNPPQPPNVTYTIQKITPPVCQE